MGWWLPCSRRSKLGKRGELGLLHTDWKVRPGSPHEEVAAMAAAALAALAAPPLQEPCALAAALAELGVSSGNMSPSSSNDLLGGGPKRVWITSNLTLSGTFDVITPDSVVIKRPSEMSAAIIDALSVNSERNLTASSLELPA